MLYKFKQINVCQRVCARVWELESSSFIVNPPPSIQYRILSQRQFTTQSVFHSATTQTISKATHFAPSSLFDKFINTRYHCALLQHKPNDIHAQTMSLSLNYAIFIEFIFACFFDFKAIWFGNKKIVSMWRLAWKFSKRL